VHLHAFGDSFVSGLIKEPVENTLDEQSQINFVTRIKELNPNIKEITNHGLRGNANQKIFFDAYKHIRDSNTHDNTFYLIILSGSDRTSHYYPDTDSYHCAPEHLFNLEDPFFMADALMLLLNKMCVERNIPHLFCTSFETYKPKVITYDSLPFESRTLAEISKSLAPCYHPTIKGHRNIAKYLSNRINLEIDKYK